MKFKLLGALGVAAVGVMGLGLTNTGAWFTDQETTTVTASAGVLDVSLGGQMSSDFAVGPLMPGEDYDPYYMEIQNLQPPNTGAMKYRVTALKTGGNQALFDAMQVQVQTGDCVTGPPPIANTYDIEPLKKLSNLNFNSDQQTKTTDLPAGWSHCFFFYFKLPPSADNTLQGKTTIFKVVVDATQPDAPFPPLAP